MPTRDRQYDYDLSQWMRDDRSTTGLYGPGMVSAWQLASISAVLWGFLTNRHSTSTAQPESPERRPAARSWALARVTKVVVQIARLIVLEWDLLMAHLLPVVAACDILRRWSSQPGIYDDDIGLMTRLLAFTHAPWLQLGTCCPSSDTITITIWGTEHHHSDTAIKSMVENISTIQACVSILEYFLKYSVLLYLPLLWRRRQIKMRPSRLSPGEWLRLALGAITLLLVACAAETVRGAVYPEDWSRYIGYNGIHNYFMYVTRSSLAVRLGELYPALWYGMPCHPALLCLFLSLRFRRCDRYLRSIAVDPWRIYLVLATCWFVLAIAGLSRVHLSSPRPSMIDTSMRKALRIILALVMPGLGEFLLLNALLLCVGPFLLLFGIFKNGGCIYRVTKVSVTDLDQMWDLATGVVATATSSFVRYWDMDGTKATDANDDSIAETGASLQLDAMTT